MKKALRIKIIGVVQGVGFRPFVFNLAKKHNIKGFVINDTSGVYIEAEGEKENLENFLKVLKTSPPRLSHIYKIIIEELPEKNFKDFRIEKSRDKEGEPILDILPDVATCEFCLKELFDSKDRRYRYPFINCTLCGPRFTIIEKIPYDRKNTSMKEFKMCERCYEEYTNPEDRRFHAQPICCPVCGPWIELFTSNGEKIAEKEEALRLSIDLIKQGKILAVKGIGGFHLMVNATSPVLIKELRKRKKRSNKPFAVMFKNIKEVKKYCFLSPFEESLLLSKEAPIVLLKSRNKLPEEIAPGIDCVGAFLPYSPLHHLILSELEFPVIATSANLSDEPIVISNEEVFEKLSFVSDYFLVHNRKIVRRCDDSVIKPIYEKKVFIRRSRGFAPLPVFIEGKVPKKIFATGPREKNTFAIAFQNKIILSQHIGDLDSLENLKAYEESVRDLFSLYRFSPEIIVCDLHPYYETTFFAERLGRERGIPVIKVQHHFAHALSCMAEHGLKEKVLAISWDGTGYGTDGTVWGGEFLVIDFNKKGIPEFKRLATFFPFRLIGGEKAVKEITRTSLSLLFSIFEEETIEIAKTFPSLAKYTERELKNFYIIWKKGINSPLCSSAGRLFDGIAALTGIIDFNTYEGEAPMRLESLYDFRENSCYSFEFVSQKDGPILISWKTLIKDLLNDLKKGEPLSVMVSRFINTLSEICLSVIKKAEIEKVVLSGGVMLNKPLVEGIIKKAKKEGFKVYIQERVPPNDGGLALGQAYYGTFLKEA